jgi:hypothetical protein
MFKVKIPKILFLALDIASFYRRSFYNTNDLVKLANRYKKDLVRQRADKIDYKYLDDTNFGGLRGNFSTLLTWKGFVKKGSLIVNYCSVGRDGRLINAICKGEIILDRKNFTVNTNNKKLAKLIETESWLFNIREGQAHIKIMLDKNPQIPLKRDHASFPKESVVKSSTNQYFIRALVNNFVGSDNKILEYNIINLWEGKKFNKKNLHLLIVIPSKNDPWHKILAVRNEDLFTNKPLLLDVDLKKSICFDKKGNQYKLYSLDEAIKEFSAGDENIKQRLSYKWEDLKKREAKTEVELKEIKEDEFSIFLDRFLNWRKEFYVDNKKVVNVKLSSSSGPDVMLLFSGSTMQKLELEHEWNNYLDHGHQNNNAFNKVWIFAEEEFNFNKIFNLFAEQKKYNGDRVPDVFFSVDKNNERHAYKIDWENKTFEELNLKF